ncbi:8746_t:CDS:10, partial [Racocetra fulgida]
MSSVSEAVSVEKPNVSPQVSKDKQTKKASKEGAVSVFPLELSPPPEYLQHRIKLFEEWKAAYDEEIKKKPRVPITVTFPDGNTKEAIAWETTPMDLAKQISKSLSERIVIAKVNGQLFDLIRPLEKDCTLELLDFENDEGHCLMFKHRDRSYRELPIRLADFGVLHRNELSGALAGLTRVRRFQQDDAHIFCRHDQVEEEINAALEFLKHVYGIFGFTFQLKLSTRPEKYLGTIEVWNQAEKALNKFGEPWEFNPGDGAFYGPKIDITVSDAIKRKHQCATLQLDFQLPERFQLEYHTNVVGDSEGSSYARPVMIHRAILGSVERMIAILAEHFAGKCDYVKVVSKACFDAGLYVEYDLGENTLNKKIRNAEIAQFNFIFVVGGEEESTKSVNIRNRDDVGTKAKGQTIPLEEAVEKLDDPFEEHAKHSPDCAWAICYCSIKTFNDEQLPFSWDDKDKLPNSKKMEEARIKTFGTWWPHEGKKGWVGTIKKVVKIKEEEIELSDMINQLKLNEPSPDNSKNNDADQECAMNLTDNQNNISDHMCDNQIETAEVVTNKEYNEEIANPCTGTPPPSFRPAITDEINSVTDKTYSNDQNILSVEEIVEIESDKEYNEEIVIPPVTPLPSFRPAITDEINSITDNICSNDQVHITDQFEKTEKPNSLTNDSNQMEITERFGKTELNSLTNNAYDNNQMEITERSGKTEELNSLTNNAYDNQSEITNVREDTECNKETDVPFMTMLNSAPIEPAINKSTEDIPSEFLTVNEQSAKTLTIEEVEADKKYYEDKEYNEERFEKTELNSLTDNAYDNNRMEITNFREDMECNKETNIPFTSTPNSLAPIELMNNENIDDTTSEYLTANEQTAKILTVEKVEVDKEYNREIAIPYTGTPPSSSRPTITDKTNQRFEKTLSVDDCLRNLTEELNSLTNNTYDNNQMEITSIREDKERNKETDNPFISTYNSLAPLEPMNSETTEDITSESLAS